MVQAIWRHFCVRDEEIISSPHIGFPLFLSADVQSLQVAVEELSSPFVFDPVIIW